ncbi:MAG: glycosyltransferase family 9 protein [Desulfobacteraceae bacterium]|nr:glycosyltransferase family 9 protein [Desulfobacteraceae bacterium]
MKILIIKLGALGDVINTFPVAVALKQHLNAEIHWLVAPLSHPLVHGHACVDKTILFDKSKGKKGVAEVIRELRTTRYDITLDLQRILKSGLFCMAARSKRKIGFNRERCKELSWLFPFERIAPSDPHAHMLNQYLEFGKHLNLPSGKVAWNIPRSSQPGLKLPGNYLVLNIGATKPANRWDNACFARLAEMVNRDLRLTPVLTGGPEDKDNAVAIKELTRTPIIDMTGRTTVPELVEVLAHAACVVSCDTGPMHLSCALGTRLVALFGPSNPDRTGPFNGIVIQKPQACTPCNKRSCSDPVCMTAITPRDVMEKISALLKGDINHRD